MFHKRCSGVRGDLSQVADGFRCKQCNGIIQEADLAGGHIGEWRDIWTCTELFYLRDTLDGDGGADHPATARIRNGWMKFLELLPFLTSRAPR